MPVEEGLFLSTGSGPGHLVLHTLEVERGHQDSSAGKVTDLRQLVPQDPLSSTQSDWALAAALLLQEQGLARIRVSGRMPIAYFQALVERGIEPVVDLDLLVPERRRKLEPQWRQISSAQEAAEIACRAVINEINQAEINDGLLWSDGRALTSERLKATGSRVLMELGHSCDSLIIAGGPQSSIPHDRGSGPILAGRPIIIDIFPRSLRTGYHGDLTRTVIKGPVPAQAAEMHLAILAAINSGIATVRAGVTGREVHLAVCR
ncbi:MAG TPA: M24 family metallopeptidase, partial [Candidatus Dormibacteraeota bacterium]|nr:M24 family metallopeptidase [Candidatus Dormibacteraeota bacterium]